MKKRLVQQAVILEHFAAGGKDKLSARGKVF